PLLEQRGGVVLDDAVLPPAHHQDAGDQDRGKEAAVEAEPPLLRRRRGRRGVRRGGRGGAHFGSFTLLRVPAFGALIGCGCPDGHSMTAFSIFGSLPRPKCRRRWFCEA